MATLNNKPTHKELFPEGCMDDNCKEGCYSTASGCVQCFKELKTYAVINCHDLLYCDNPSCPNFALLQIDDKMIV